MDFVKFLPRLRRATDCAVVIGLLAAGSSVFVHAQEIAEADSAGSGNSLLERFVAEVSDFSAGFEQSQFDADGRPLDEVASGRFSLLRPSRFIWHQQLPFELIWDADGEFLWTYDVDLEQVTRAPLAELAASPAMLLSGEGRIGDNYEHSELPVGEDGLSWIELTPIDPASSDFLSARIAFDDNVPVAFELTDGLRNLTRIRFFDIELNSGLEAADFDFEPPAGVFVVGAD